MILRRRWRVVSAALALAIGFVGCNGGDDSGRPGPATGAEAEQRVPPGYVEVEDAEAGVAVAVPANWQIPRNAELLQQQADAVREQDPRLAEILVAAKTLISQAKIFALHPEGAASFNLLVKKAEGVSLDNLPGPAVAELRRRGATVQSQERTTLGGVAAVKITMKSPFTAGTTVDQAQYYAAKDGKTFILTFTGSDPALEVIVKSVRFT